MTKRYAGSLGPENIRTRLLAAAVGSSPVAVFVVNTTGTVVFAEGGGVRWLTGGQTAVDGLAVVDAWGETPMLVAAIGQALGGVRFSGNLTVGERRFAVRVLPMFDGANAIEGAAGLAVEAPHASLDKSESTLGQILDVLVEELPFSVWILDQRGDVVRENGLAKEQGLSAIRTARENGPAGAGLVGRVLLDGKETVGVARVRDAAGAEVELPVRGVPLRNANGSTVGAVLTATPIAPLPAPPSLEIRTPPDLHLSSVGWDPIPEEISALSFT
jgi:hypothetical protein